MACEPACVLVSRSSPRRAGVPGRFSDSSLCGGPLADRLGLSGVPTIVTYAITAARQAPAATPARLRVPSYAAWEATVWNASPLSDAIGVEPQSALLHANGATSSEGDRSPTGPRLSAVGAARRALLAMGASGEIGDDAFHRLEEEIDRLELSSGVASTSTNVGVVSWHARGAYKNPCAIDAQKASKSAISDVHLGALRTPLATISPSMIADLAGSSRITCRGKRRPNREPLRL